MNQANM